MRLIGKILRKAYEKVSNIWYRMRLKNDNFTIITNTCIAGVMYHKLGTQFLSPTINLWMEDPDFYRFARNMDYYFAQPLRFVQGIDSTPTAYCGDVVIHFNHYKSDEEANEKWEKRKKRINMDNLFIISSDRAIDGIEVTHDDIACLNDIPCKGRVVFSTRRYDDIDYIVPLPKDPDGDYVNQYMLDKNAKLNRWRWESAWDWVYWLNTGKVIVKS